MAIGCFRLWRQPVRPDQPEAWKGRLIIVGVTYLLEASAGYDDNGPYVEGQILLRAKPGEASA